jgi:hypothetical protein
VLFRPLVDVSTPAAASVIHPLSPIPCWSPEVVPGGHVQYFATAIRVQAAIRSRCCDC